MERLQVADVTTDLGTRGAPVDVARVGVRCAANGYRGDDGALVRACGSGPVRVFDARDGGGLDSFTASVECGLAVGLDGCALEQPLAAAVTALDHESFPPPAGAVLVVVVLSDEDDCSLQDPVGFFAGSETGVAINQRCVREPGLLVPIDGVLAGLRLGREEAPLIFAALVGLPEGLSGAMPSDILASPEMAYEPTNENGHGLRAACERGDIQAAPGRRFAELADQIDGALVSSICAESFRPAIAELAARIGESVTESSEEAP